MVSDHKFTIERVFGILQSMWRNTGLKSSGETYIESERWQQTIIQESRQKFKRECISWTINRQDGPFKTYWLKSLVEAEDILIHTINTKSTSKSKLSPKGAMHVCRINDIETSYLKALI